MTLQQQTGSGKDTEETFRIAQEVTGHDVELIDIALRSVVLFHKLMTQSDRQRERKERPTGLPVSITALHRVQAPAWMMKLAWVPSSPSLLVPPR